LAIRLYPPHVDFTSSPASLFPGMQQTSPYLTRLSHGLTADKTDSMHTNISRVTTLYVVLQQHDSETSDDSAHVATRNDFGSEPKQVLGLPGSSPARSSPGHIVQ